MSMKNAGRISLNARGEYNAATEYKRLDFVTYNGSSYFAKQSTTGNNPTRNSEYWQFVADENTIDVIKVNNEPVTITNKTININIPSTFDASAIVSGTINIDRLPSGALERLIHVADIDARFALTENDVQLGDVVQQDDTGVMYMVVNTSALDSGLGYNPFNAGMAASVPWEGVTNKPEEFAPTSHRHNASDIDGLTNITCNMYTLYYENWVNDTYTLTIDGLTSSQNGIVGIGNITTQEADAFRNASIRIGSQTNNSITLIADGTVPAINLTILVTLFGD